MYCTIANLITQFGLDELIQRVGNTETNVLDEAELLEHIGAAERFVDGYLRKVYPLPLAANVIAGSALPEMTGKIVRSYLFANIDNEEVARQYNIAVAWLRDVQDKRVTLGELDASAAPIGTVVVRQGQSSIDWAGY